MRQFRLSLASLVVGCVLVAAHHAAAQQRTTATYNDWTVQCESQAGPPQQRVCEMAQVAQVQNQPFSRLAIARPVKGQPAKMLAQLPVNVSFSGNVRIQTADNDPGLSAPFSRCVPAGCFADFELKDDVLRKFRATTTAGKLSFKDAGGRDLTVPVSFKGFGDAFDALSKE